MQLLIILLLPLIVFAQGIEITRDYPKEITAGQELNVTINLKNNENSYKNFQLYERIGDDVDAVNPLSAETVTVGFGETERRYSWDVSLMPMEQKNIQYTVLVKKAGTYNLYPTAIVLDGIAYFSNANIIDVKCVPDTICEEGENNYNCPQDCSKNSAECRKDDDCGLAKFCKSGIYYRDFHCENGKCKKTEDSNNELCSNNSKKSQTGDIKKSSKLNYFMIIALFAIVVLILFFYFELKRKIKARLQLNKYIVSNLKKGYSKQQIVSALIKDNYNSQEIEEAFKRLK